MYIFCLFIGIINIWCIKSQVVRITAVTLNAGVTLTCRLYYGTENENGIRWYQVNDAQGVTYVESPTTPGACIRFAGGSAYNLTRFTTTCNAAQNNYTLSFTVLPADFGTSWCCSYILPSSNIGCEFNVTINDVTTASSTTTTNDALCQPGGALFIILDICIIISYIIMVILIIDLITWNKYSPSSKFMACVKIDHRCLRILYIVLFIVLVICEIVIVIVIIIGRQCGLILIVGLVLGLIIIAVTCIFLIVFIKTEVVIYDKDKIQNPRTSTNVKIAALLRPFFLISDVEWIGPKGNTLTTEGKYIIAQYNRDTGETSLTINNVSQDDNGSYICQAKILCIIAEDSNHILCDKETSTKTTGPPASHIRTQNKVEPKTTSKQTNERLQPLPPVGGVVEVKLKLRQQPPPPKNIDAKDQNLQSNSANYEDAQGPPTGTVRLKRLTPLTSKQPTVQEEDTSEEKTKKTRKKKKKKKGQRNEENKDEETAELKGQRTSSEDQADEY